LRKWLRMVASRTKKKSKRCLCCGAEFVINSNAQKHCGSSCRQRHGQKLLLEREPHYWKRYYSNNREKRKECARRSRVNTELEKRYVISGRSVYRGIKGRCNCKSNIGYCRYGARGIKCLISWEEFQTIFFHVDKCEICDRKLSDAHRRKGKDARTIDRINPKGHYKIGNLRVVCRSCNAKGGGQTTAKLTRNVKK